MDAALWFGLLAVAAAAANWGADRVAVPFQKVVAQFGLTGAAGGALIAIVTAGPEVGINTASAFQGVGDIGLGNMLGANIISVPLIVAVAWAATRWYSAHPPSGDQAYGDQPEIPDSVQLDRSAITVQGLPYLGIVALVALLTLPPGWRGLQPVDGWIMVAAFVAFYLQALLRGRRRGAAVDWSGAEIAWAVAGVLALGGGAWAAVTATDRLAEAIGLSQLIGGLFVSSTMSVAPEAIKTWILVKVGQATAGTTSVIADNAVTMTLGFLPLALISTPITDIVFYGGNLIAVGTFGVLFVVTTAWARRRGGGSGRQVGVLATAYGTYVIWVLMMRL